MKETGSFLRYSLLALLVICGLILLLSCDILSPEDEPWLRVWWVEMDSTQLEEDQLGIYLRAYTEPDQLMEWGLLQEWPLASIEWTGTMDPGYVLQLPMVFQEEECSRVIFWAGTSTLGPDTIHYDSHPGPPCIW